MQGSRRVVVTGLGSICALGDKLSEVWAAIVAGQSGARMIDRFDCSAHATRFACSVPNFNPDNILNAKEQRRYDLFLQYGMVAAHEAVIDAGLNDVDHLAQQTRIGVAIGAGIGGLYSIEKNTLIENQVAPRKVSPFFIPGSIINMVSGLVAEKYHFRGPNFAMATACASGCHSIGFGARSIAYGDADVMVVGASESAASPLGMAGFNAVKALSKRNDAPEQASRPWDKDRDGFVMGEGAGILVIEELEHAKARGANIYAELAGFGMSAGAYHMTAADPSGAGFVACMENALRDAQLNVEQIDYVNAHGTSTPLADPIEHAAVKQVFGSYANQLAMSSTKSMTGHLLGAAAAVESIFSIKAINDNVAPPTINLDNPEEGCDMNLVANVAQQRDIQTVLCNSFGFGGTNATLIFKQF